MADDKTRKKGFILIVEDDRGTGELEAQRLETLGFEIRLAGTAEEAFAVLQKSTPELMLLDYSLPGDNAVKLLNRLRAGSTPVPPFLIVTGRGDETVAVETMKSGASDYIIKNSDFLENLLPAAMKALDKAALQLKLKQAEEARLESEAQLAATLRSIGDGVISSDSGGLVSGMNSVAEHMTGWTADEAQGRPVAQVFRVMDSKSRAELENPVERVLRYGTGISQSDNTVLVARKGARYQIVGNCAPIRDASGAIAGAVLVFRDVTDEYVRRERLRESEEKYRLVVDNSSEAISVIQDGKFRFVNPALMAVLGYSEEELKAAHFPSFIHPGDRVMVVERHQKRLLGEDAPNRYSFRAMTKAGNAIEVEINAVRIAWEGRPAILCLLDDITERRKAERVLKEAAERKSRFASMVSHELRNPMTSITLAVGLVLEAADYLRPEHKTLLELVRDNAVRLDRLIHNILGYQKMAAGKMAFEMIENDPGELIRTTVGFMRLQAGKKGLSLTVEMNPGLPRAKFDRDKIIQVLTNLLGNAIAHTARGGIVVRVDCERDMLHVAVRDTGAGIRDEDLHRLFQPFEQLGDISDREPGGTGLGLVISKEIILAHNGKIWAESEFGKGSVFHFTLPAVSAETGASGAE